MLHDDDVQGLDTRWDEVLLSIRKVSPDHILESLHETRRLESDQLKTVLAVHEREIEQYNSEPTYQKLNTMVKKCLDQKIRAQKIEARNERIEKGAPAKRQKGNLSAWKGSKENAINGKTKGKCTKEDACSFRHDENKCGKSTSSSRPAPEPPTKSDGKNLRKKRLSEVGVRLGRDLEDRAKTTLVGNVRTPRVTTGILPCVRSTKENRDADSVKCALSCSERLTISLTTDQKKSRGKGSVALLKNSRQVCCVSTDIEATKSNSILRKGTKSLLPKRSVQFSRGTLRHVKIR